MASKASARMEALARPPDPSSPRPSRRTSPTPRRAATCARTRALTTAERTLASLPSAKSGKRSNVYPATMRPRTASPRNSRRSLEGAPPSCSPHQLRCARACCRRLKSAKEWPSRSASAAAPSAPGSTRLELGVDVVNCVPDRAQVLEVLVIDAEPHRSFAQLLFQGFDQLNQGQRISIEVLREGGALGDRRRVRLEDVGQLVPDQLEDPIAVERALIGVGFGWHGDQCTSRGAATARLWGVSWSFTPIRRCARPPPPGRPAPASHIRGPPGPRSSWRLHWRSRG